MIRDTVMTPLGSVSSFLSCEKDAETIFKRLFIESKPYSDSLKRLLVLNTKDCLTDIENERYNEIINRMNLKKLKDEHYISLVPKMKFNEHEEVKAYIILSFDNFTANVKNPNFRDCTINFDIICHTDYWELDNYQLRPLKICGYIDGILNNSKLSGIGEIKFLGCNELILNEDISGYSLSYRAIHGYDDSVKEKE